MITLAMFIALWICTAKDIRGIHGITQFFILYIIATAIFPINSFYLYPVLGVYVGLGLCALFMPWREYPHKKRFKTKKRWIKYPMEVLSYRLFVWILRLLPLPLLSWLGGKILGYFGPRTRRRQQDMSKNLAMIMPENNNPEFMKRVWNNWGRTFVEGLKYKTYRRRFNKYVTVKNWELTQQRKQYILSMPHLGLMALVGMPFAINKVKLGVTYKAASNPLTNDIILSTYGLGCADSLYFLPVGNAIPMVRALKDGDILNINSDQRFHGADYLDFMGKPARTSTGTAQLARKFNLPVLVAHVHRTHGAHHEVIFDEFVEIPHTDDAHADEINGTLAINAAFERIIRAEPSEYLWMHRRWA